MNIKTRDEFEALLQDLRTAKQFAVDTETNGLDIWRGHRAISMSFYFPDTDHSYNFAWGHGNGTIEIPEENADTSKFHKWTWQGKGKKQVYKAYWFDQFQKQVDPAFFGNCPIEWLHELRDGWNSAMRKRDKPFVVYFNAPFDIHMMEQAGFNQPPLTYDVRIAVALAFEDWNHPSIGGNNRLKWQAAKWGIPGAIDGERDLDDQAEKLSTRVAEFVAAHWDDPMNTSFHALKRAGRVDEIAGKVAFDSKSEMWCMPSDDVALYAENDTRITWLLHLKLLDFLGHWHQVKLYSDLSDVQAEFLVRCERNGIYFDRNRAAELIEEMQPVMEEVNEWFASHIAAVLATKNGLTPEELKLVEDIAPDKKGKTKFTVGSPAKLKRMLEYLTGMPWKKTDKDTIARYEDEYGESEVTEKIKHYRHASRAVSTYLRNWVKSEDEYGFIHGGFNANGTITGRISSSSGTLGATGNFQNIPSRGFVIKECLITPPGWGMFQFDYSALELRLAAWIAQCQPMIDNIADPHSYTRDKMGIGAILHPGMTFDQAVQRAFLDGKMKSSLEVLQTDEEKARKELNVYYRQVAKTLNFGLLYGGTWKMVSRLLKLDEETSRELHTAWNNFYPEFKLANDEAKDEGMKYRQYPIPMHKSNGVDWRLEQYVVQPISNRTRKFGFYPAVDQIYDKVTEKMITIKPKATALKDGFNYKVQGLGGYIMVMSGLQCCREFGNDIFRPFATIHDSLNPYIRRGHFHIIPRIIEIMCDWDINPRLAVEVDYSPDGLWQHNDSIENLEEFIQEKA